MPTTLTVQGNFGQIMSFVNGLDSFPRLFVIQKFVLGYGAASSQRRRVRRPARPRHRGSAGASSASVALSPPLWVGGTPTSASAGPYNLAITGSIYYTSTPDALDACTKATAAQSSAK